MNVWKNVFTREQDQMFTAFTALGSLLWYTPLDALNIVLTNSEHVAYLQF